MRIQFFPRAAQFLCFTFLLSSSSLKGQQAFALTTTTTSTTTTTTLTATTTTFTSTSTFISRLEWQEELLQSSHPLVPTPLSQALETLQRDGVVRLENIRVDSQSCQMLRDRILQEITNQQQVQQQQQQVQQQQVQVQQQVQQQSLSINNNKDAAPTKSDLPPPQQQQQQQQQQHHHHHNHHHPDTDTDTDTMYVPGTRLRFRQAMDLAFGGDARHDLLLPLETWPELTNVLQAAVQSLEPLLQSATHALLPRLYGSSSSSSSSLSSKEEDPVELVELASLVVRPGSTHQPFHGDFRRFEVKVDNDDNDDEATAASHCPPTTTNDEEPQQHTQQRQGKLPPRLVTFVALQPVPTLQHGVTAFVTGTQTGAAHALVYHDTLGENYLLQHAPARIELLETLSTRGVGTTQGFVQGEVLVYDASVLHWGSTNSVPDNHRVMLYFGVSRAGDAALLSCPEMDAIMMEQGGFERVPPVTLQQVLLLQQQQQQTTLP
jgi:hypothetical protein